MKKSKYIGKKHYSNTKNNESESESETETLDLKDFEEKKYDKKSLSKTIKGTSSKNKEIKSIINQKEKSTDIKDDIFRQILEEINEIKYKHEIFEKEIKELKKSNVKFEKDKEVFGEEIRELKKSNVKSAKYKEVFGEEIRELKKSNVKLAKDNEKLAKDEELLQKHIEKIQSDLMMNKNESVKNYNKLLNKIDLLENQIKELQEFHFSAKLRKLLKNLIGFIINNFYPHYIKYQKSNERLFFFKAPRFPYNLQWAKDKEIIDALNRILELLFSTSKEKDFVVHFVDQREKKNNLYKKVFNVFEKTDDFFRFFNISNIDKNILIELIPENYFTQIDNLSFEINIKELKAKISDKKNMFNNKKK